MTSASAVAGGGPGVILITEGRTVDTGWCQVVTSGRGGQEVSWPLVPWYQHHLRSAATILIQSWRWRSGAGWKLRIPHIARKKVACRWLSGE